MILVGPPSPHHPSLQMQSMSLCSAFSLVYLIMTAVLPVLGATAGSTQSFPDISSLQGILAVWVAPSSPLSVPSRGCVGALLLGVAGSSSSLSSIPCNSTTDSSVSVNLTAYAPTVGLMMQSTLTNFTQVPFYYTVLAPVSPALLSVSTPPVLATFSGEDGSLLSAWPMSGIAAVSALLLDPIQGWLYVLEVKAQTISLHTVNSSQSSGRVASSCPPLPCHSPASSLPVEWCGCVMHSVPQPSYLSPSGW